MKRRGPPIYAPELIGNEYRLIVEREFLKLQEVIDQVAWHLEAHTNRFEALEQALAEAVGEIDEGIAEVDTRIDSLEGQMSTVLERLDTIDEQIEAIDDRLTELEP